jgi:phage tail tape measure protein, TP901 family|nr:MAG TPA: minor tail protein [Caudoviricetes sp.]
MNNLQIAVLLSAVDKMSGPLKNASRNAAALSGALKESRKVRNQLNKQEQANASSIKKYAATLNPLKNKLSLLNQELVQAQQKSKYYAQQLANAKNPTAEFKAKVEAANQAVKKLKSEQGQTATKLKQARHELNAAGLSSKNLANRQRELKSNLKDANQQIEQQSKKLIKLNAKQAAYNKYRGQVESLKNISTKAQIVGAQSMAAGATILAPIKSAVNASMEFEDAMLGVARQVEGVKDKMGNLTPKYDEWKQKIFQMSRELPKNTVELANMVESAARMGIAENEIENFIRKNVAMTIAFDVQEGQGDEFTEKMGRVRENLKLTQESANALADTINYLDDQNLSKGTEIIDFLNDAAGMSNMVKMSEKDLAAWGSTLITAGNEAGKSAKAFGSILTRLGSNKKPVKKALAAIGLNPDDVKKGLQVNATETVLKVFEQVKKKIPDHLQLSVLEGLAGGDYNKVFANLVANPDMLRKQLAQTNSEEAKGSMDREFQTRMKGLSATFQTFKNSLHDLKIVLGDTLSPVLNKLMQKISPIVDRMRNWITANPELARKIMIVTAALGGTLTVFGALSLALSFVLYPLARVLLTFSKLDILMPKFNKGFMTIGRLITRGLLSPLKLLPIVFSPIGIIISGIALLIYKYWQPLKSFFGGFWEGLKSGLAPVIEKFKPLGALFGVVVGWLEKAVKWFTDLLSPVQSTQKDLDAAASAGKKFGEWLAAGIDLVTKPLQWLMDSIQWVIDHMPSLDKVATSIVSKEHAANIEKIANYSIDPAGEYTPPPPRPKWSGGYAGNGGKYQPMGVYHGGEYIMTKETTSRLGVPLLNALNYGKNALLATGLSMSVATAAPIQVDNRPPLAAHPVVAQSVAQPMAVNITINAAPGQDERTIARMVTQEMQRLQNQQQARQRSSMRDRE